MIGVLPGLLDGIELGDATLATGAARLLKTPDEIECLRHGAAHQRGRDARRRGGAATRRPAERAVGDLPAQRVRAGARRAASSTRSGASRRSSVAAGTRTANADVGFPLASNDRFLREGDLIMCDTGITWMGYHSDFGKTWICSVDPKPTAEQRACLRALVRGDRRRVRDDQTGRDVRRPRARAAAAVEPKHRSSTSTWATAAGCDSGEAPFIGSDLGIAFDDTVELAPGMVFVLEPVVWRDGVGGYRSEEIVAVTDDGFEKLTTYGYTPFE